MVDPAAALIAAFHQDPLARWLFPAAEVRRQVLPLMFAPSIAASAAAGELAAVENATAVWIPLAAGESAFDGESRHDHERLKILETALAARHPRGRAHLYLPFLGVAPAAQGRGLGSALLADRLARADREGIPAYLEASSARNRPLYERHGFTCLGPSITLPTGPEIRPMWREPKERGR